MKGVVVLVGDTTLQIPIPVEAQGSIVDALKFMSLALTVGTSESMLDRFSGVVRESGPVWLETYSLLWMSLTCWTYRAGLS